MVTMPTTPRSTVAVVTLVFGCILCLGGGAEAGGGGKDKPATPTVGKKSDPDKPLPKRGRGSKRRGTTKTPSAEPADEPTSPEPTSPEPTSPEPSTERPTSDGEPKIVGKVIYGEARGAATIATVDLKLVFEHIPSYKKIKEENLKKTKARYHFLLAEANQTLQQAVELVALTERTDVVVEAGGVENPGDKVVDLTQKVIDWIEQH